MDRSRKKRPAIHFAGRFVFTTADRAALPRQKSDACWRCEPAQTQAGQPVTHSKTSRDRWGSPRERTLPACTVRHPAGPFPPAPPAGCRGMHPGWARSRPLYSRSFAIRGPLPLFVGFLQGKKFQQPTRNLQSPRPDPPPRRPACWIGHPRRSDPSVFIPASGPFFRFPHCPGSFIFLR